MRVELTEVLLFEQHAVTLPELSELSALPISLLEELVSGGAIEPLDASSPEPHFGAQALSAARAARRLRDAFELDSSALILALGLLDRVHELEAQLRKLRAQLPGSIR